MNRDTKKELIKEAITEYRIEEAKAKKKQIYHDTELLMRHYNGLKQHSENAVYKVGQIFQDEREYISNDHAEGDEHLYIGAILKSKIRTAIMIQHIDMAIDTLKNNSIKNGYDNKYNAFVDIYIQNLQYNELATKYNCTEMTVRRWKNEMISMLSILLFGEEGLILGA